MEQTANMKEIHIGAGRQTIDFETLVQTLNEQQSQKYDVVMSTNKMTAVVEPEAKYENEEEIKVPKEVKLLLELPDDKGMKSYGLTQHAHKQLAEKCGIPTRYYDRMQNANKLDLITENVNNWIQSTDRRMVRIMGDRVRAIVSDRYFRLDNYIVATETFNKMKEHGMDFKKDVQACHLSDTKMYIRVVIPFMQDEIKVGDIVKQGLIISNSEVGAGAFKAEPFLWRLACLNGMIANHSMARIHLGSKMNPGVQDMDIFSEETRDLELETVLSQIKDIIENTFDQDFFYRWTDILRRNTEIDLGSPTEAIDNFTKLYSMKHAKEDLLDRLVKEGDSSQYGLVNAITSYAKDQGSYDRQIELERIAGDISFMEEPEFRRKIATEVKAVA